MRVTLLSLVVILYGRWTTAYPGSLAGHQIWKLDGSTDNAVPTKLMMDGLLDVLDHSRQIQRVRVSPQHIEEVQGILRKEGLSYQVIVDDLASHVEAEEINERARRDVDGNNETCTESQCPEPFTKEYMTFEQMEWYLKELNKTNNPNVKLTSIGKSHENRDMWLIHIKSDNADAKSVWIEGGIHAREWISPAVAISLIPKLMNDEDLKKNYDFFITPMANPDGYAYTWNVDRMWRKNRRDNKDTNCEGVDLNRNWDYHFGVGASQNPCSEVYRGTGPFSEPETKAVKEAMLDQKDNLVLVLSLHSYGQDLLYPWGWNHTLNAPNKAELIRVGKKFAEGAKTISGSTYDVVNSAGGMYYASGATDDWALGEMGTKYVYTLELRDKGSKGFLLTKDAIEPTIDEVWEGFQNLMENIE